MKKALFSLCVCVALFFTGEASAREREPLTIDLAEDQVKITTGFSGGALAIFGEKNERGDVVVILEGPARQSTVRKKERILGAWINTSRLNFKNIPSYYDYALNPEEDGIMASEDRRTQRIGLTGLKFDPSKNNYKKETVSLFQDALLRDKQGRELFPLKPQRVDFISDNFFRVDFALPANVPSGEYTVRALLVRNQKVVYEKTHPLHVGLEGLSSDIYVFARDHAVLYGLSCIALALLAGWLSNVIVRRS